MLHVKESFLNEHGDRLQVALLWLTNLAVGAYQYCQYRQLAALGFVQPLGTEKYALATVILQVGVTAGAALSNLLPIFSSDKTPPCQRQLKSDSWSYAEPITGFILGLSCSLFYSLRYLYTDKKAAIARFNYSPC